MSTSFPYPNLELASSFPLLFIFSLSIASTLAFAFFLYISIAQPFTPRSEMKKHLSDKLLSLCRDPTKSVSHLLSQDPSLAPAEAAKKIFGGSHPEVVDAPAPHERELCSQEELEKAKSCGRWGTEIGGREPSELFLRVFRDALLTLEGEPLEGVCSPCLMGSCGVLPLTVVGSVWDVCRHMVRLMFFFRKLRNMENILLHWDDSSF